MSDENAVRDGIAEGLAELEQLVPVPTPPLGYGVDLRCTTDIHEDLAEVDPFSALGIAEAIFRRWTTLRGDNPDDPEYGHSVIRMLNRGMTRADIAAEAGLLRAEAEKEERVAECEVAVTTNTAGSELRVAGRVTPEDSALDPFTFVVAVTNGEAMLNLVG